VRLFVSFLIVGCVEVFNLLFRRDKNIWVIGGGLGKRFADNSSYFFRFAFENSGKKIVWLSRTPEIILRLRKLGYAAYHTHSLKGLWYGLRASWHIYDVGPKDTNVYTIRGAYCLNLWHGIPLKDIRTLNSNFSIDEKKVIERKLSLEEKIFSPLFRNQSKYYVLSTGLNFNQIMSIGLNCKSENIITANYPRNDFLTQSTTSDFFLYQQDLSLYNDIVKLKSEGWRVVCYLPTWRETKLDKFLGTFDLNLINQFITKLEAQQIKLITKWHPVVNKNYQEVDTSTITDYESLKGIIRISEYADINSFISLFDLVITDYSGIMYDYALLDRPLIFYPYDFQEYTKNRGLLFQYESFVPGPIVYSIEELENEINAFASNPEYATKDTEKRKAVVDFSYDQFIGSAQIVTTIKSIQ
jgi:CDP-glycerol glycerophosphotransferase (TagB/SpsB family)